MKIIEMLKRKSDKERYECIENWYNENAYTLNKINKVNNFKDFYSWLDTEYKNPLLRCPFKCAGCSREVIVEATDGGDTAEYLYTLTAYDEKMQLVCMLDGSYDNEKQAIQSFNQAVSGKV